MFGPEVTETALYHINRETNLALIEFRLFKVGVESLLQVKTVLGEIPRQRGPKASAGAKDESNDGYAPWLLSSIGEKLPDIIAGQGWQLRYRIALQSLPFGSVDWPLELSNCQFRLDVFKKGFVSLRFSFRQALAPGLTALLQARSDTWRPGFPAKIDHADPEASFATLTLDLPRPEIGNKSGLDKILSALKQMTEVLHPLIDGYFEMKTASTEHRADMSKMSKPESKMSKEIEAAIGMNSDGSPNVIDPGTPQLSVEQMIEQGLIKVLPDDEMKNVLGEG